MGEWHVDGQKLRDTRKRAALSMRDLAGKAGVGYLTVFRLEHGRVKDARPSTLRKLAAALKVEPAALMSEEPDEVGQ
jgi:transcriptional regulator with XRE-family HTH domain